MDPSAVDREIRDHSVKGKAGQRTRPRSGGKYWLIDGCRLHRGREAFVEMYAVELKTVRDQRGGSVFTQSYIAGEETPEQFFVCLPGESHNFGIRQCVSTFSGVYVDVIQCGGFVHVEQDRIRSDERRVGK